MPYETNAQLVAFIYMEMTKYISSITWEPYTACHQTQAVSFEYMIHVNLFFDSENAQFYGLNQLDCSQD
jgi:hypothetical protein